MEDISGPTQIRLRDYQSLAIEQAREAIRSGSKNILICAPTGAGKTVLASHLIKECDAKGRRANFVVDRVSLIQQTGDTFDKYGIEHGVIQASHPRFAPSRNVQICSVQTVRRRKWPESSLDLIDECHVMDKMVTARVGKRERITVGLTATPFAKGLGKLYDSVVNVTTTNRLIEQGFLSPYRIYSCEEPDMDGVPIRNGEFEPKETEKRALGVVGDVVSEYLEKGEGRKFICSAVNTLHVEELQRQFLGAGINCATYTYKDKDEDRDDTLREYRKEDSQIQGLITVSAASRGFDVASIGCVIMARPLRKSLAEHIQFMGRGLRIHPTLSDCIILDHSGNCARMWHQWRGFFEDGMTALNDEDRSKDDTQKEKPEKKEAEPFKCPQCGHLHLPQPFCPQCGWVAPPKGSVIHLPGTLKELKAVGSPKLMQQLLWPQVVHYVTILRGLSGDAAQKKAQGIYKGLTGEFAKSRVETTIPVECSADTRSNITANMIRFAKGRAKGKK